MKSAQRHGEQEHDDVIVSFFFNARGNELQRSIRGLYRSLIHQLLKKRTEQLYALPGCDCEGQHDRFKVLEKLLKRLPQWGSRSTSGEWPLATMKAILGDLVLAFRPANVACCTDGSDQSVGVNEREKHHNAVLALARKDVTFYLDALDECDDAEARDVIELLGSITTTAAEAEVGFRVFLSSRHYPHIAYQACQQLILESQLGHKLDIAEYIRRKLQIGESHLALEVHAIIQARASGVFFWVVLVVRILNDLYDRGQIHRLRQRLDTIPKGIHKLLEEILQKDAEEKGKLLRTFQWVLFPLRPLELEEFYHAVTFESGEDIQNCLQTDISADDMRRFLLDSSKGLAEMTKGHVPTVQFVHESVKDYLFDVGLVTPKPDLVTDQVRSCHTQLQHCCRRYLETAHAALQPLFARARADALRKAMPKEIFSAAHTLMREAQATCPFLDYALVGTVYHADYSHSSDLSRNEFVATFPLDLWRTLYNLVNPFHSLAVETKPLYIFILTGACDLAEFCMDTQEKPREWPKRVLPNRHRSLLGVAVSNGDHRMVEMLLSRGIGANWPAKDERTCLELASWDGDKWMRQKLIDAGATFTELLVQDVERALWDDCDQTARMLIESGMHTHTKMISDCGDRLLVEAAASGGETTVRLLLDHGVYADFYDDFDDSPLDIASTAGHKTIVNMLLEAGDPVPKQLLDSAAEAARWSGIWAKRETIVDMLLEAGDPVPKELLDPAAIAARASATWVWDKNETVYEDIVTQLVALGAMQPPDFWSLRRGRGPPGSE